MKGLLVKDFLLIKRQLRTIAVVILIGVMMSYSLGDSSYMIGYLAFVVPILSVGTISYDEFDNGNAFLFTLPFTRKQYVQEKYLLTICMGMISMILGLLLVMGFNLFMRSMDLHEALYFVYFVFLAVMLVISIMIPLTLKYGGEKAKTVRLIIMGGIILIGVGTSKLLEMTGINFETSILHSLQENTILFTIIVTITVFLFLTISYLLSLKIICHKDF